MIKIKLPLNKKELESLKVGDEVSLSGKIYTARDQAHKRLVEALSQGKKLPIDLKGAFIYYCGPAGTPKGKVIGACGPTTSNRMDGFTAKVLKAGVIAMIGKGSRSEEVRKTIKKHKAVYFAAPAGCGALLAQKVKSARVVAYADLGPEAVRELLVEDFPLIVAIDARGKTVFDNIT